MEESKKKLGRPFKVSVSAPVENSYVARQLARDFHLKTLRDAGEVILYYQDGIYHRGGETLVKEEVERILGSRAQTNTTREILHHIKAQTYVSLSDFSNDPNILNLKNGVLNRETLELKPHNPDFLSLVQLPIEYDPEAECPRVIQFCREVLKPEHLATIEELFGYCLYRGYPFQRLFLMVGDGANGKSTLLELLQVFLGERNCSNRSLQAISNNRFASADLVGKLANICSDLPSSAIYDTGLIKSLTGRDRIAGERKYQDSFEFSNYAKLIFSTNRPPAVAEEEQSYAFWRRIVWLDFPNSFEGKKADPFILSKLTMPGELSGLLNIALVGLKRLFSNGDFSYNITPAQVAEKYVAASDSTSVFINECCGYDSEQAINSAQFYDMYRAYCKGEGLPARDQRLFGRDIARICGKRVEHCRVNGQYGYRGLYISSFPLWMNEEEYNTIPTEVSNA